MKKAAKQTKKKSKRPGQINGTLMAKEQRELRRKLIDAEMLLTNAEHNYKVAQGYIGDIFSKAYVEKKYGEDLKLSQRRLARLQGKLGKGPPTIKSKQLSRGKE